MAEDSNANVEIAHHLSEHGGTGEHPLLETIEAIVLAIIAITTAWSGYQAALWNGHQSELYGVASKLRVQAQGAATAANQERIYDASVVADWLKAEAEHNTKLADIFERRLLPEFRPAFEAWKKTDPLNNPDAPAGPAQMTEYHSAKTEESAKLEEQAAETFEEGNLARDHSDRYVRVTVTLATLLLLVGLGQRFKISAVRMAIAIVVVLMLCLPLYHVFTLPTVSGPSPRATTPK